jgi:hypothetical protein
MPIANTKLPDDFVDRILQGTRVRKPALREGLTEKIFGALHRPLISEVQWAIIDHLNKLSQSAASREAEND